MLVPFMRFLVISDVENIKNDYILQEHSSPEGIDAHKLTFSHNWMYPSWDIADWAVSHIGVPYAIRDRSVKIPYVKNDCSGFVTTARIQELDECGPGFLAVSWIASINYYDGSFTIPGHDEIEFTERVENPCGVSHAPGWRGYLLFIRRYDATYPWTNRRHIGIIYHLNYDCESNMPINCLIVHARGGHLRYRGRVSYNEAMVEYAPYDPDNNMFGIWVWTFIRFR